MAPDFFDRPFQSSCGDHRMRIAEALDMAYVAAGRFDGYWERDLNPWDLAAGMLLVTEAGGKVTDADGDNAVLTKGSVVAGNLDIHPLLLSRLTAAN